MIAERVGRLTLSDARADLKDLRTVREQLLLDVPEEHRSDPLLWRDIPIHLRGQLQEVDGDIMVLDRKIRRVESGAGSEDHILNCGNGC